MKHLLAFIDRHPSIGVAFIICAFGLAGTLDRRDQEIAEAYNTGVRVGVESKENLVLQIDSLCSKDWPDVDGASLARSRVCNSM